MEINRVRIPSEVVLNARIAKIESPEAIRGESRFWNALTRHAGEEVGDRELVLIVIDALGFARGSFTSLSLCVDLLIGEDSPDIASSAKKILEGVGNALIKKRRSQGVITV